MATIELYICLFYTATSALPTPSVAHKLEGSADMDCEELARQQS